MFIALRDGQFDHMVESAIPAKAGPAPPAVKDAVAAAKGKDAAAHAPTVPHLAASGKGAAPAQVSHGHPKKASSHPPGRHATARTDEEGPPTTRMAQPPAAPQEELTLDIDALERAAAEAHVPPSFEPQNDLPPPPANLFRAKEPGTGGAYSRSTHRATKPPRRLAPSRRPPPSRPASRQTPSPTTNMGSRPPRSRTSPPCAPNPRVENSASRASSLPKASRSQPPSRVAEARYAPARPPPSSGGGRVQSAGTQSSGTIPSVDKSLDEVILSYLAEDLEAPSGSTGGEKKKK